MQFWPGRVFSRPGLTQVGAGTVGNGTFTAPVLSLKEFVTLDTTTRRILALTADGVLWKETTPGTYTFSAVASALFELSAMAALKMNSVTAFGREYICFSTGGRTAYSPPLQFDDVSLRPVAPGPPGDALPTPTLSIAGSVSAGFHELRLCYLYDTGFMTAPGPPVIVPADGSHSLTFGAGAFPIGPPGVVARVIVASPNCSHDLYAMPGTSMWIADNTTTGNVSIDFTDIGLIAGQPVSVKDDPTTDREALVELPPQAGVGFYSNRVMYWGERRTVIPQSDRGFRNLSFQGGFNGNRPTGWGELVAGESDGTAVPGAIGGAVKITGTGAQAGCLENRDLGAPQIPAGVDMYVRIRVKKSAGLNNASALVVYFSDVAIPGNTIGTGLTITGAQLSSSEWRYIEGVVRLAAAIPTTATTTLRVSGGAGGAAINAGEWIAFQHMQIYRAGNSVFGSLSRISKAGLGEEHDGLTGLQLVSQNDGQNITNGFELNGSWFWTKERSLHRTYDPGANPSDWPIARVSSTIGTLSSKGVGKGDGWVVIAARGGLYFFNGAQLTRISTDQWGTWKKINWLYGHQVEVHVDTEIQRIYVLAPLSGSTTNSKILDFEYEGSSPVDSDLSVWSVAEGPIYATVCSAERNDGTKVQLFGVNGAGGNRIVVQDDNSHRDYGAQAIACQYRTAYFGSAGMRSLFDYVTSSLIGSGDVVIQIVDSQGNAAGAAGSIPPPPLSTTPLRDLERGFDVRAERVAIDFSINVLDSWFGIAQSSIRYQKAPMGPVRGGGT